MSGNRENLQKALSGYISDTVSFTDTVKGFCGAISPWAGKRKAEVTKLKGELNADTLAAVLQDTLRGLEELDRFLDAVEKLAVTSLYVFCENQVFRLLEKSSLEQVCNIIKAARMICPLLLSFKRDAKAFFQPKLQNVVVMSCQLDKYAKVTEIICDMFKKCSISDVKMKKDSPVILDVKVSEDDINSMLSHIHQLREIRMDPHFRMVFLFQAVSCSDFINEFNKQHDPMLSLLKNLETVAGHLDSMNKGARISNVVGNSVGALGGVLSIGGLLLAPFTAGASLALTASGLGLGITSGVTSAVTTATEVGVNTTEEKKANTVFHTFMDDMQRIQDCLDKAICQPTHEIENINRYVLVGSGQVIGKAACVAYSVNSLFNEISDAKLLRSAQMMRSAYEEANLIENVGGTAAEIAEAGGDAFKGSLALSGLGRAAGVAVNALFFGLNIFFICKDSIGLAKGSETEVSKLIRDRVVVWRSEIDAWQRMRDSLCEGQKTSGKKQAALMSPHYSEKGSQKQSR